VTCPQSQPYNRDCSRGNLEHPPIQIKNVCHCKETTVTTAFQTAYKQNLEKMTVAKEYAKQQREIQMTQAKGDNKPRTSQTSGSNPK
jgi:hypothetical protein